MTPREPHSPVKAYESSDNKDAVADNHSKTWAPLLEHTETTSNAPPRTSVPPPSSNQRAPVNGMADAPPARRSRRRQTRTGASGTAATPWRCALRALAARVVWLVRMSAVDAAEEGDLTGVGDAWESSWERADVRGRKALRSWQGVTGRIARE